MRILLVTILSLFAATTVCPQRCGDHLLLYLRDRSGKVIPPSDFSAARVSASYTVANVRDIIDAEPQIKELPHGVRSFSVRVECGMRSAQFGVRYKGEEMVIRVLNIPGDALNILMDGIVFRRGAYEVDVGGRPLQNVEKYHGAGVTVENETHEIEWVIRNESLRRVS